jgi:hypothetical protein
MHKTLVHETNQFTEILKNSKSLNLVPELLGHLYNYNQFPNKYIVKFRGILEIKLMLNLFF